MESVGSEEARLVSTLLGSFIALIVGIWVMSDASRRGKSPGAAILWGLGTFMAMIIFLPLWLMTRPKIGAATGVAVDAVEPAAPVTRVCDNCGKFFRSESGDCPYCSQSVEPVST